MNEAGVFSTFLIVFRETLEASLIVGIILTVLSQLKAMRYGPYVGLSVLLAVLTSFAVAFVLDLVIGNLEGRIEKIIEGCISLIASGVLTYMVFWMDKQAKNIRSEIELQIETAVSKSELFTIILLPFLAVLREGFETVLFLRAVVIQSASPLSLPAGIVGLLLATAIAVAIFLIGKRIPLKSFFQGTGALLILIAAGLLAYGIHELHEVGWIPPIIEHIWDINHILNEKEGFGLFLKALFGYNGNPSLVEVIAYFAYLTSFFFLLKKQKKTPKVPF